MQSHRIPGAGSVGSFVRGYRRRHQHRQVAEQLRRLDDHLLQDIGITRADAERAAAGRIRRP